MSDDIILSEFKVPKGGKKREETRLETVKLEGSTQNKRLQAAFEKALLRAMEVKK